MHDRESIFNMINKSLISAETKLHFGNCIKVMMLSLPKTVGIIMFDLYKAKY